MFNFGSIDPERAKVLEFSDVVAAKLEELQEEVCNSCGEEKPAFFCVWAKWQGKGITFQLCRDCTIEQLSEKWLVTQGYTQLKKIYPWMEIREDGDNGR